MVEKTVLSNGLRLVMVPMQEVKSVAVLVLLRAGSRYENKETLGLTHFYEHMVFKGTRRYPSKMDLALAVDQIGAEFNGLTSKEYTAYYIKGESRHLETALRVLSEMICQPLLKEQDVEQEKPVIVEEINMREDNPQVKVDDTLGEVVFPNHPLGFSGAGEKETIKSYRAPDFLGFKEKFYTGENLVVVISGKFSAASLARNISNYFGGLPEGERGKFIPAKANFGGPSVRVINKKTDQVHLSLGFRGFPRLDDKNRPPQSLLDTVLGGGMSSRLFQKVREEKSLAYYVDSSVSSYLDTALFGVSAGVDKKRVGEALETILGEIRGGEFGVGRRELRKAKDYLRGHFILSLEEPLDRAFWYGVDEVLENRLRSPEEVIKLLEKVTPGDVSRVARQIFTPQNLSLAIIGEGLEEEKLKMLLYNRFISR